jgi:hypothetical protein
MEIKQKKPLACATCHKTEEEALFRHPKGQLRRYCVPCYNAYMRTLRARLRRFNPKGSVKLKRHNEKVLRDLKPGFYVIQWEALRKATEGFLGFDGRTLYLHTGKKGFRVEYDIKAVAAFLANRRLLAEAIKVRVLKGDELARPKDLMEHEPIVPIVQVQRGWIR